MQNEKISVSLTVEQWNLVLNALGTRPFAEVNEIVYSVKRQAEEQIGAKAAAAEPEAEAA
jgi:hypothetical protein